MAKSEMNVRDVYDVLSKSLLACETDLERKLMLQLVKQIADYHCLLANNLRPGYGFTDGDEIDELDNVMRAFSNNCMMLADISNENVDNIHHAFNALHRHCLHNFYANREKKQR